MAVGSETQVKERPILLVGLCGVLGTGIIDAVAENPKRRITTARADRRRPIELRARPFTFQNACIHIVLLNITYAVGRLNVRD